jgi:hypothetical protein
MWTCSKRTDLPDYYFGNYTEQMVAVSSEAPTFVSFSACPSTLKKLFCHHQGAHFSPLARYTCPQILIKNNRKI